MRGVAMLSSSMKITNSPRAAAAPALRAAPR
jgi:hypothetical protein